MPQGNSESYAAWITAKRGLVLSLAVLGTAGCTTVRGPELIMAMVGDWCLSIDEGKSCWNHHRFTDTTIHSCGVVPKTGAAFEARSSYTVEGALLCQTVVTSSLPDIITPGYKTCTEIIEINTKIHRFRSPTSSNEGAVYRKAGQGTCLPQGRLTPRSSRPTTAGSVSLV